MWTQSWWKIQPLERTTAGLVRIVKLRPGGRKRSQLDLASSKRPFAPIQGWLRLLLVRNSLALSGVVARVLIHPLIHIFAVHHYGMRVLAVVTNLALGLGCGSLPWNLRNQNKDQG
jgi:hypothetical protein